jgi:hypothetical protein
MMSDESEAAAGQSPGIIHHVIKVINQIKTHRKGESNQEISTKRAAKYK